MENFWQKYSASFEINFKKIERNSVLGLTVATERTAQQKALRT